MSHGTRRSGRLWFLALAIVVAATAGTTSRAGVTREEVERAIRDGVRYLKEQQRADGSWPDVEADANRARRAWSPSPC